MNNKITPYPQHKDVFNDDNLEEIFLSFCSVDDFSDEVTYPLHFIFPHPCWHNESHITDNNGVNFALFNIENGKYTFNGDMKFYGALYQQQMMLNSVIHCMKEDIKPFFKKKYINFFIENGGYSDRGSAPEWLARNYIDFLVTKYKFENKKNTPMVHFFDTEICKESLNLIESNHKSLLPNSIDLEEWMSIGVILEDTFFTENSLGTKLNTHLFWHKERHQALCVYTHS